MSTPNTPTNTPDNGELQRVAKSPAYEAGFIDGQAWSYEPAAVRVEGWVEDTVHARGERAFGRHIGLSDPEIDQRGDAWSNACADYNRGCVDGVTYARRG